MSQLQWIKRENHLSSLDNCHFIQKLKWCKTIAKEETDAALFAFGI